MKGRLTTLLAVSMLLSDVGMVGVKVAAEGVDEAAAGAVAVSGLASSESGDSVVFPLDPPAAPDDPTWYHPLVPARLLDTRPAESTVDGLGRPGVPLAAGASLDLQVLGRGGVPSSDVSAVVLNITVAGPTAASFLTVWPTGADRPLASNLNFVASQVVPNLVVAKVGTAGNVSVYNLAGQVDVIADVAGYFPATDDFVPLVPARLYETRFGLPTIDGLGHTGGRMGGPAATDFQVAGRGGVPATGVDAVVLNVTATNAKDPTFITVWPAFTTRPVASNLNVVPGQTVPNLVIAKLGLGGKVALYNNAGAVDLIVDVAGYFPIGGTFVALQPARVLETRPGLPVAPGGDQRGMPIGDGQSYDLRVLGVGGVPDRRVSAVVLNVTVVDPTASTFLTVWPTGMARPTASNLNMVAGRGARPNLVVARVGAGGRVSIYNHSGQVDVVVDVAGYFTEEPAAVRDVVTSGYTTCVLDWLGRATCWGTTPDDPPAVYPEFAVTPMVDGLRPNPYPLGTFDDIVDIAVGAGTCVLRVGGLVWCWGSGTVGGLTGGGSHATEWPALPAIGLEPNIVDIDAGGGNTCALAASGRVSCWGHDYFSNAHPLPEVVTGLNNAVAVSAGPSSACALLADGRVACWGRGAFGMLGDGSGADSATPVVVSGLTDADGVEVESGRSCATRTTGEAVCWGISFLGSASTGSSLTPVPALDGFTGLPADDIWQIEGGAEYSCAVRFDDNVYCLGSSSFASLGLAPGHTNTTTLTVMVEGLPPVEFVSGDYAHLCAVTYESDVYCWGNNTYGQVGNGTLDNVTSPTLIYSAFS